MIIRQLSVFLENKIGMFAKIARLLGDNGINMLSFNISETQDFGIARIIVEKEEEDRALSLLKANSYAVSMTPVLLIHCNHVPGAMANILEQLSAAGVSIEYLYAFAGKDSDFSRVVIRPDNLEKANQIAQELQ
ncbi:MAG: ACT domain-containing protein [Bacteroidaceae bacterium]|nr:ACT domain-containing protein [Bacteroidaceae bacterium]